MVSFVFHASAVLRFLDHEVGDHRIELAMSAPDCTLITADFDFKPAEHLVSIEFLPRKPVAP